MKIYVPNISRTPIGGGFSFLRNFKEGLKDKVEFVDNWEDCEIVFVFGITAIDKGEIIKAVRAGKKLVLRVDNIPRKSRNRRQSPAERLREFGEIASAVVYQSEWCKKYVEYFAGPGIIINNGVDTSIFNPKDRTTDRKTFLYINYNDNPNKRFDEAMYWFEQEWKKNNDIKLIIAGTVPRIYLENPEYNWDLNVPATVEYVGILQKPKEVAALMKKCTYILFPAFAEAYPNTLLEAMACGVDPVFLCEEGGAMELYLNNLRSVKTIQEMGDEYLKLFKQVCKLSKGLKLK